MIGAMRFLHPERDEELELSLDDVFLNPGYFEGTSRSEVDLAPADFPGGAHPIVSANMNAVTGPPNAFIDGIAQPGKTISATAARTAARPPAQHLTAST